MPAGLTFERPSPEKLFVQLQNREIGSAAALVEWLVARSAKKRSAAARQVTVRALTESLRPPAHVRAWQISCAETHDMPLATADHGESERA